MSPRFGELLPADVWAATTRTLSAFTGTPRSDLVGSNAALWSHATREITALAEENVVTQPIHDSIYGQVTPASSASADTFGSWVQISANVGNGKTLLDATILAIDGFNGTAEVEIGEGAAGSEAAVARFQLPVSMISGVAWRPPLNLRLMRALTNGARLSARVKDDNAAANNYRVSVEVA